MVKHIAHIIIIIIIIIIISRNAKCDFGINFISSRNDYVYNSLLVFTKFCIRLGNMVSSTPIVSETNRK